MKLFLKTILIFIFLTFLNTLFAEESITVKKEESQSPISLSPSLSLGWGYDDDNYFSASPNMSLSANFKSATGRKISFSLGGGATFREFVSEEQVITDRSVESTGNFRDIAFTASASGSTEITSKISISLGSDGEIYRSNTWETWQSDGEKFNIYPGISFTPVKNTTLSFAYYFTISAKNGIATQGAEPLPGEEGDYMGNKSIFPDSIYDPNYPTYLQSSYYQSVFGPSYYEEGYAAHSTSYKNSVKLSASQSFDHEYAPSLSGAFSLIINQDSTSDSSDLWLSPGVSAGITQPLWKNANGSLKWSLSITNYDQAFTDDNQYYKQVGGNTVILSLSQTINDYLSLSGGYTNYYEFDNNDKTKMFHYGEVSMTATF